MHRINGPTYERTGVRVKVSSPLIRCAIFGHKIYYQSRARLKANFISSLGLSIVLIYAIVLRSLWQCGHFFPSA